MYPDSLDRIDAVTPRRHGDAFRLDLSGLRRVDPLHLVAVAALAHYAHREGSWLDLHSMSTGAAGYAARMGLGRVIEHHGGRHCLPETGYTNDRRHSLLELSRVNSGEDARHWAKLVHTRARSASDEVANALHEGLGEISDNVPVHSTTFGYAAAQTYESAGVIRFAVADAGIGLRATLAGRGASSDRQALGMALDGQSSLDGTHGLGLRSTWALIRELDGHMTMASMTAAVHRSRTGERRRQVDFPGTIFEGCIPANLDTRHPKQRRPLRHDANPCRY